MKVPPLNQLAALFGNIDIYLFDQLLKGRIQPCMKVLDAGCGNGRNLWYLLHADVEVYGIDSASEAVQNVRQLAAQAAPNLPASNFMQADAAAVPFQDAYFEVILCSAVLHFAKDQTHFKSMVQQLWRVLKPGGMLFCRLSTTIGMEGKLLEVGPKLYQMPHRDVWFLADEALLLELECELEATRLEPLKTVLVEQQRSMTTWVLQK